MKRGQTDKAEKLLKESLEMRRTSVPANKAGFAFSELFCLTVNRGLIDIAVVLVEQLLSSMRQSNSVSRLRLENFSKCFSYVPQTL